MPEEKRRHFLYYIFHFDKKRHIMEETKAQKLKTYLLRVMKKEKPSWNEKN